MTLRLGIEIAACLVLTGLNGFLLGRIYEHKYGFYRKAHTAAMFAIAMFNAQLDGMLHRLNGRLPDGSVKSPIRISDL